MASKAIEKYANGSDIDRIIGSLIYGEHRLALSTAEQQTLEEAEYALELLDEHNNDVRAVVGILMKRVNKELPRSRAYQACVNAQAIFGAVSSFDYFYELLLKKNRLAYAIGKAKASSEWKDMAALEKEHTDVLEKMRLHQERMRPEEPKVYNFILHCDYTKLGWSEEQMAVAKQNVSIIIQKQMRKLKGLTTNLDATTVEYQESR